MMGRGFYGGGWHGGEVGLIGPLFMLVMFVLMVVLLVLGISWLLKSQKAATDETDEAKQGALLETLKKTYASGQIDTKEFEARKKILEL